MILRPYQDEQMIKLKASIAKNRFVFLQSATGSGKTVLFTAIMSGAFKKGTVCWVIVPRGELLHQADDHFKKYGIPHNLVYPGHAESKLFKIHIWSKDTLIRRWDKVKVWPDLIIIDEGHLNYFFQLDLISRIPETTKIIAFSATPERLSGESLGDIYQDLILGPSIPELTALGYLSTLRYFSPPIDGIENIHRRGTEYDPAELEQLLEAKKIYGEVIKHYQQHGAVRKTAISMPGQPVINTNKNYHKGRPALIFCRSVESAYKTAEQFQNAGFKFYCIEGKMLHSERKRLINALKNGEIDGLSNCEICTYGLDVCRVEYGASIRPTESRALYFQMVGRILRPYTDEKTGFKKEFSMFFDHVNLYRSHGEPVEQNGKQVLVPPFYLENIDWNFNGKEKRKKRDKDIGEIRCCPYDAFRYCDKPTCEGCQLNVEKLKDVRIKQPDEIVDLELKEITEKPVTLHERPPEERKEYQDRISKCIEQYAQLKLIGGMQFETVNEMLKIADELTYSNMWVYHKLTGNSKAINIPLLNEIARIKKYKPGWVWMKRKELEKQRVSVI
jgi:DNA repair protein RadD